MVIKNLNNEEKMVYLTNTEKSVLTLVSKGLNNGEIAKEMMISISTVKKHLESIYLKLSVHNRVQAVCCAFRMKILDL